MQTDAILVIFIALITASLGEFLTYLFVYRKDEYKHLNAQVERKARLVEKLKQSAESVAASKTEKKKLEREEEQLKEANKAMSMFRMKSGSLY